ncbi:small ribosomal subunit protein mS23 [Brachyistius frenatus]|uniref:small ribosomal subunit protein mS23 n=1 Tax=Brachyistius frenatus TaxID=100188 RepID=UPI0037E947ED
MAGSRLERFGTVFSRVRDLMRSGVVKPSHKPVWYDVYEAFPPNRDPLHVTPPFRTGTSTQDTVPEVFYREDEVRASFYEQYGNAGRLLDLSKSNFTSTCQRFVEKFSELKSRGELDDSVLLEETGKALLSEGVILRRRGAPQVTEARDPVLELKLMDMLAEQQSGGSDPKETTEQTHAS